MKNFLLSSALYWIESSISTVCGWMRSPRCCISIIHARKAVDSNKYAGENLAIDFMRELNTVVHSEHPGAMVIAENPPPGPQVTRPTQVGLGSA